MSIACSRQAARRVLPEVFAAGSFVVRSGTIWECIGVRGAPDETSEAVMKTCLIVDDSSVIRKVARRILEGLDFRINEAEDGQQAIEECRRNMPDAILLDWNMPVMDGYEFLKAL